MKMEEIQGMSIEQRNEKVAELKKELFDLRFQLATGNLEDTARIQKVKKDIARIKTTNNQK